MKKLGKYEILEQIGQGAMGIVYKALDPFIERIVAVKTMSADLDADPELRSRFFREARSAGQLSHKNIVTIYELGEESGTAYIAMEFLDGQDIKERISRGERLPLEDRLRYMIEIVEGLSHAHKKGVFHRDIKPGNIYITNTGQVKILDFGLARIASSDMTRTGSVMGTPNYMSPEQIRGVPIDCRSDIFSAGATFYELLTYRKPFNGDTLQSTFYKILQEDPLPLEAIDPAIPVEFSTVILRAMAKEPTNRYQTADDMLQDLVRLEKTLQQHKRRVKAEAREAVEMLERLVTENKQLLKEDSLEFSISELKDHSFIRSTSDHDDSAQHQHAEAGFLEIIEVRDTAKREHHRLEVLLQKQQHAASLLTQAAAFEQQDQLEKALELVEEVIIELPNDREAIAYSTRIRKTLSDRAAAEARDAIEKLAQLINDNKEHLKGEEHFSPDDLKAGIFLASMSPRSIDKDATVASHLTEGRDETLRIRDKARAERERLKAVLATKKRILAHLQEAMDHEQSGRFEDALRVAHEILNEFPTHTEAQALVGRVRETLARRAREEEKKREVVGLLRQSWQLYSQKKLLESLAILNDALDLDKQNPEVLAFHRQVSGDIEQEKQKQEREAKADNLFRRAATQFAAGELQAAHTSLVEALDQNRNHSEAARLVADVERRIQEEADRAEKKRKLDAAITSARKSLETGEFGQARQDLEYALSIDPQNAAAKEILTNIVRIEDERRTSEERRRRVESLIEEAVSQFRAGNDESAEARLRDLLEIDAWHAAALELRKKIVESREARGRAILERKSRIGKTLSNARELEKSGDLTHAFELINSTLKEDAGQAEALELTKDIENLRVHQRRLELELMVRDLLARADETAQRADYAGAALLLEGANQDVASVDSVQQRIKLYRNAEKAEREKKERIAGLLNEARKAETSGELEKARGLVGAVLEEDSAHTEARELLTRIEKAIHTRKERDQAEEDSHRLLAQAGELASRGNYREATSILEGAKPLVASLPAIKQAIEQYRKSALAQEKARERARRIQECLSRGKKAFEMGNYADCEREMDQILALEAGNPEAVDLRGRARDQIQKQRDEERRLKELADSLGAAERSLKTNDLDAARGHISRAKALDPQNADAARLQSQIEQRDAELREQARRKQRSQDLHSEAQKVLEADPERATVLLTEAVSLGLDASVAATLQKRIDKQRRRVAKKAASSAAQVALPRRTGVPKPAQWLGVVIGVVGIGLLVWMLIPKTPQYQEQMTSARSYLDQKQFDKARDVLQQIPSSSPLYAQAQNLINQAREDEKKQTIDALVNEASNLRKQGQNEKSLATAQQALELDPSNSAAKSLRDEIERENFATKSEAQREQYVTAALTSAEQLFKSGDLERARQKADEVLLVRPNDGKASSLKQTILVQLESSNKANIERSKAAQAKVNAQTAKAPELASARFAAAQRAEALAVVRQNAKQFDQAGKLFADAASLYGDAEKEARAENQARSDRERENQQKAAALQALRGQAEVARTAYQQNRAKAQSAEAEGKAADRFQAAARLASDAQAKFDGGDFGGARTSFEAASNGMVQAQEAAVRAAQASQQPAPTPPPPTPAPTPPPASQPAQTQVDRNRQPAPAVQNDEAERQAIRGVIERYRLAYEGRNIADVKTVFPGIAGREETVSNNNFDIARSIQMKLIEKEIQISGETARATYQQQIEMRTKADNKTVGGQSSIVFSLGKRGGSWIIVGISR